MSHALTPLEWAELHQLYARYAWALGHGEVDTLAALFTAQGWVDDLATGRLPARAYAEQVGPRMLEAGQQDWVTNLLIEGDGQACRVRAFWMVVVHEQAEAEPRWIGHTLDHCCQVDGLWRFASRTLRPWDGVWLPWATPAAAALAGCTPPSQAPR